MINKPNILLITIDSLRADYVYEDIAQTPALDQLRQEGVTFETAIAQGPFTTFSMPSIFTSKYPSQLTRFELPKWGTGAMVGDAPTLQERLSDAGYRTLGIHSNPLLSKTFGFDRGFDRFYDSMGLEQNTESRRFRLLVSKIRRLFRSGAYVSGDNLTDRAVKWVEGSTQEPYFLWVHYMDPHGPYKERDLPPIVQKFHSEWRWRQALEEPEIVDDEDHERLRNAYRDEVRFVDEQVGRLLDTLRDHGEYEDMTVVVSADHGEEFREHGNYSHGNKVYDELLHVPLIIKSSKETKVHTVAHPVPLLDISPTLSDISSGDTEGFEGKSLQPIYHEEISPEDTPIISEADLNPKYRASVRTDQWKYAHRPSDEALYDLENDPNEQQNVLRDNETIADTFRDILSKHVSGTESEVTEFSLNNEELKKRLETLGYI